MKKFCFLLFAACLFADEVPLEEPEEPTPWFTGPLIAPIGYVVPIEHFEIDIYNYLNIETADYNGDWSVEERPNFYTYTPQIYAYFGLTPWMDLSIWPQFSVNWTEGARSVGFNDFPIGLDFQLYSDEEEGWFPGIKVSIMEYFPTGKYQRLNPNKLSTDSMGFGAYSTFFSLIFYKVYHISDMHFMSFTLSGDYTIPSKVHVHGFNAYGGGFDTDGHVKPGHIFQAICSFEYSLTQNWNLALDTVWTHENLTTFSGEPGTDADGNPAEVGSPSSESLSFAPAIEYGFSENLGIIGGCWFSAIGRNSAQFRNAVVNLYYYY